MAYVIGSQKGKDIAKNMSVGSTYTASDGSTWKKESNGSVTVTESNGKVHNNAYTSSSGGSSSGGSSGGGTKNVSSTLTSIGGGSSNGGSNYVAPTLGNTWDANTDYQAIINNAVANRDYETAGKAELLRNQKIISTGSNYARTNNYSGYLPDYSTIGLGQVYSGANWQDVQETLDNRTNKALYTPGLEQYANDDTYRMMYNYIADQKAKAESEARINEIMEQYESYIAELEQGREEYQSQYDPEIDRILNEILNRDDFSYDVTDDPLYQQYAQMYQREGDRAMRETLAEAAAGAGGMNSYAITAASQAYNNYNTQLTDKIPELYQLAYQMYINDKESKVQDLGILQNMDATQYSRYRDTINDYYADKNFALQGYQTALNQANWQTNFDYNSMINNRDYMYNDYLNQTNQSQYDRENAEKQLLTLIESGQMPSDELITSAGWNKADVERLVAAAVAEKSSSLRANSVEVKPEKKVTGDSTDWAEWEKENLPGSENYTSVEAACEELLKTKGKDAVLKMLGELYGAKEIDTASYLNLYSKYRG